MHMSLYDSIYFNNYEISVVGLESTGPRYQLALERSLLIMENCEGHKTSPPCFYLHKSIITVQSLEAYDFAYIFDTDFHPGVENHIVELLSKCPVK